MTRRLPVYILVLALVLAGAAVRWGCRAWSRPALRQGTPEALLAQIEESRQRARPADRERLARLTAHQEPQVARAAMDAMVQVDAGGGQADLGRMLDASQSPEARAAAAEALGHVEAAAPLLARALQTETNEGVRAAAARGLARICGNASKGEALAALVAALRDRDSNVRAWAIRGIQRASGKRFLYEPAKPPGSQEDRIRYIEARLHQCGLL